MKNEIVISLCLVFTTLNANNLNNEVQCKYCAHEYTQNKKVINNKQDLLQTFKLHHKSAVKGYSSSQYELGLMFHYGSGVRQNSELARLWLTRAAKKGHGKAQSILYRFYAIKKREYISTRR